MQGPIVWELWSVKTIAKIRAYQVRRPVLDEGARTCPDPWPSLGIVIVDPDTCIGSASQLEGEQNLHILCVGSELHAAPSAPQNPSSSSSPFPSPSDTLVRNLSCGEGAATEQRTTDGPHPEHLKLPDLRVEDLEKSGGASALDDSPILVGSPGDFDRLGLACTVANVDVRELEPSSVDVYERGGALPVVGAAPTLAEETAGVEPAGEAERAAAAKPEALAPWTQGEAGREVETPPREGEQELKAPPHKGRRKPEALPPEGERKRRTTSPRQSKRGELEPVLQPREVSRDALRQSGRKRDAPSRVDRKGVAGCMHEALPPEVERERGAMPREDKRVHERPPRKREREVDKPQPEALPQKGERNPEALSQERECERARRGAKCKPKVAAPARKGEREHAKALPPEDERKRGATPQGNPNEGDREPSRPSRASSHEDVLSTWKGPGPWDPGGRLLREHASESRRPVEAMDTAAGIVACNKKNLAVQKSSQSNGTGNKTTTHLGHTPISPSCRRGGHPNLRHEARTEGAASSWKMSMSRQRHCKASQRGRLVAVTLAASPIYDCHPSRYPSKLKQENQHFWLPTGLLHGPHGLVASAQRIQLIVGPQKPESHRIRIQYEASRLSSHTSRHSVH